MSDADNQRTTDQKNSAEQQKPRLRLEAAAVVVREQILPRLGEPTGREMSEEIAKAILSAADAIMPPMRMEYRDRPAFLIEDD